MTELALRGLRLAMHPDVYPPAEDTELLLDTLARAPVRAGERACDVGTGTGAIALHLALRGARVVALDTNPHAAALARANAARNCVALEVVRGSLLAPLRGPFSLVTFNPPYLPVEGEVAGELPRAWEGGAGGIAWAPAFLDGLQRCLAPEGSAWIVASSLGNLEGLRSLAGERGFALQAVASRKLPWERLDVLYVRRGNA